MPRYTTTTKGIPEVTQPKRPEITYSEQKTEQSWIDQGFDVPEDFTIYNEKKRFLSEVDVRKTPLDRKPTLFIRQKVTVTDTKTKKRVSKEVLIYHEVRRGRNWIGKEIAPATNIEGVWYEQEKEPMFDDYNRMTGFKRSGEHPVYEIIWEGKKTVDKIIEKTGADINEIKFCVRFQGGEVGVSSRSYVTYTKFTESSWETLEFLQFRPGGVTAVPMPATATAAIGKGVG